MRWTSVSDTQTQIVLKSKGQSYLIECINTMKGTRVEVEEISRDSIVILTTNYNSPTPS